VVYVRDLIGHSFSTWGQAIKRERCQIGYTDFLRQGHYDFLDNLLTWINLSKVLRFELKIYNYSNYKKDLHVHFLEDVLRINPKKAFIASCKKERKKQIVNRSMSNSEYELLRLCNKFSSKIDVPKLADNLCHEISEVNTSYGLTLDKEMYEQIVFMFSEKIAKVNQFLCEKESIKIESIALFGKKQKNKKEFFCFNEKYEIDNLQDVALRIEKNEALISDDSYFLMYLAYRFRPKGPFINKKLRNYQRILSEKKMKH